MQKLTVILSFALSMALACDEPPAEPETETETETETGEEAEVAAPAPVVLSSIAARIGGLRTVVGQFAVELRPEATGVMKAFVSSGTGEPVEDAELEVTMQGADGQPHAVALSWDASASAYVGTMADTTPVAGTATVKVTAQGATAEAEVPRIAVAATPVYGGHVVLVGDIAAEVRPEADGVVYVTAQGPNGYLGADADVNMKVSVTADNGDKVDCPLTWDAPSGAFVGVLPEGASLANGAVELSATLGGVEHLAGFSEVSVVAPSHEGDVVAVGDLSVELVPAAGGRLTAYVTDAAGEAVKADANVTIEIAGVETPTVLAWDEAAGCHKGELAADVDVTTAPLVVAVDHGGRARRGGIAVAAGRALGVTWRSRVASGAGGAIPPGQEMRLASNVEVRGRVSGNVPSAGVEVAVSAMGAGAAAGMVTGQARAEAARARAAAVNVQGQAAERARANTARVQASAMAAAAMVQVRPPAAPMFNASAMAGAGAMGGSGGGSGSASVMIGF